MKLKYRDIVSSDLVPLIAYLQTEVMPLPTAIQLRKLARRIDDEIMIAMRLHEGLGHLYAIQDEHGYELLKNGRHKVPEHLQAQYDSEFEKFLATEFDADLEKLKASDLSGIKILPTQLATLELVVDLLA